MYNSGVKLDLVGAILRHGSGSEVTLKHYVEVEEETKANALNAEGIIRRAAPGTTLATC